MIGYVARRLGQSAFVFLGASLLVFWVLRLTGDPARLMLPPEASEREIADLRRRMGLEDPLVIQYARFLHGVARGDFGVSIRHQQPSLPLVLQRLPATLELAAAAMLLSVSAALPVGIVAAVRRNTIVDRLAMTLAISSQSTPIFWLGIVLILIFSVNLHLLPPFGRRGLAHLVLPAVALSAYSMARIARLTRSTMLEVLGMEYIRTARAKGASEGIVIAKHALKNASIPIITLIALEFGVLLGGAIIIESVFSWPGIGLLAIQAVQNRDYPLVQAIVFVTSTAFILVNLVTDVLYAVLDPRIEFRT